MASEPELLRLLDEAPGDVATLQIYADWLEEQGDHHRAAYLRTLIGFDALPVGDPAWKPSAALMNLLGASLERDWPLTFGRPTVAGHVYTGINMEHAFTVRFLPDGEVSYSQPTGNYQNGTWWQHGSSVFWEMNRFYAEYSGRRGLRAAQLG